MQPTNTTYNAFSGPAPASNDNAFQSAIDYLIANRKKPVFNSQGGLFTQGSNKTESKSSVMTDLFGDQYIKRSQGDSGGGGAEQPFTGNPYSSLGLSSSSAQNKIDAYNNYRDMAAGLRNNSGGLSAVTSLFGGPVLGVLAKYGAPALFDYLGNRQYQSMLDAYQPNNNQYTDMDGNPVENNMGPNLPTSNTPYDAGYDFNYAGGSTVVGGQPGVGIDSGNFDSGGGGYTDAGGGSFDYSADTGYDR